MFSFSTTTPHARLVRSLDELDGVAFPAIVKPSGTSDRHDDEASCVVHEPAALELAVSYLLARHPYGVLVEPYVCAICADRPLRAP